MKTKKEKVIAKIFAIIIALTALILGNVGSFILISILDNMLLEMALDHLDEEYIILIILFEFLMFVFCTILAYGIITYKIKEKKRKIKKTDQ